MTTAKFYVGIDFDETIFMKEKYHGQEQEINVDGQTYQIQPEYSTHSNRFLLKQEGHPSCTISRSDEGKWQSDCGLNDKQLSEIGEWIKKNLP
jgi:hypothetical protein